MNGDLLPSPSSYIFPDDRWLFLTWHLHGALPPPRYPPPGKLSAGQEFVWIDRYLDITRDGPQYLRRPEIAQIVVDSLHEGEKLGHYELGPYVVMANHVHVLLLPQIPAPKLLKGLKGFTAREANKVLGFTGNPFWQGESYDHWVRDENEWNRIASYIEKNAVKAGIVAAPEMYPWSSAHAPA
jgi:REP element-mobilizing transposase RayT